MQKVKPSGKEGFVGSGAADTDSRHARHHVMVQCFRRFSFHAMIWFVETRSRTPEKLRTQALDVTNTVDKSRQSERTTSTLFLQQHVGQV